MNFSHVRKPLLCLNRPSFFLHSILLSLLLHTTPLPSPPPAQVCTSIVSPAAPFRQRYYFCATCNIDKASGRAVCETCKDACHAGHRIIEVNGGAKNHGYKCTDKIARIFSQITKISR